MVNQIKRAMKELSIEEKAKRYDEAIIRAKSLIGDTIIEESGQHIAEVLFPELKESEDERIRKQIIVHIKWCEDNGYCAKEEMTRWIAWLEKQGEEEKFIKKELDCIRGYRDEAIKRLNELEKQGEQKPVDKVEPKFKVGDWVVWDNKISCHIDNIYQGKESLMYTITDTHNMTRSYSVKGFDNNAHLWKIQDAKDGDVLACNEEITLFKSYSVQGRISLYCWYNGQTNNFHSIEVDDALLTTRNKIWPATKEQRDLLFQKMKEAGYEWDAEKKELSRRVIDEGKAEMDYCFTKMMNGEKASPIWSEEDETGWTNTMIMIKEVASNHYTKDSIKLVIDWLKSLKERIGG